MLLTVERLRDLLDYDPLTGVFSWRVSRSGVVDGKAVGWVNPDKGRLIIRVDQRTYRASRLAWLHYYGKWPHKTVDHIDGDKLNDRIANLRDVAQAVNNQNLRKAGRRKNGGTLLGAHRTSDKKQWRAQVHLNGKVFHLGTFESEEDAHAAYLQEKRRLHPGCTL